MLIIDEFLEAIAENAVVVVQFNEHKIPCQSTVLAWDPYIPVTVCAGAQISNAD